MQTEGSLCIYQVIHTIYLKFINRLKYISEESSCGLLRIAMHIASRLDDTQVKMVFICPCQKSTILVPFPSSQPYRQFVLLTQTYLYLHHLYSRKPHRVLIVSMNRNSLDGRKSLHTWALSQIQHHRRKSSLTIYLMSCLDDVRG